MDRTIMGIALVAVMVALAGCTVPSASPEPPGPPAAPLVSCVAPCLRAIDAGVRWEPSVAVDPTDPLRLVASSQDQTPGRGPEESMSWGMSHVSLDGGATWRTARLPGGLAGDPAHPLFRFNWMDDSVVAFLPDGTLLWTALVFDATPRFPLDSGASLVVLRSSDGGLTFPEVAIVQEGGGWSGPRGVGPLDFPGRAMAAYDIQDKQWPALAPDGTVLLVWSRNHGGSPACDTPSPFEVCTQLVFSTSRDGGRSWTPPGVILEDGLYSGAFPLVRADGGWVVSFRDTTQRAVRVALSTDQGATWTISDALDATTKFPVLARTQGPVGERIHMAYPAGDEGHDGPQVVKLRQSDDGGATWSEARTLDVPERDGRTIPALAPAGEGGVFVSFWHVREEGAQLRVVVAREGMVSEPLVLDTTDGPTFEVGDYMGLAALPDGGAFAVWGAQHAEERTLTGARLSAR